MCLSAAPASKWLFVLGLPRTSLKTIPIWTPRTLGVHNSLFRLPIEMSWSKLVALLKSFPTMCCTPLAHTGVGSILASLTHGLSFVHNLCCRCLNGSCEAIFDIYTSRTFQQYKEHLKARCCDPWNWTLNFQESQRSPHFRSVNVIITLLQSGVVTFHLL
jgi:hypothetical protein